MASADPVVVGGAGGAIGPALMAGVQMGPSVADGEMRREASEEQRPDGEEEVEVKKAMRAERNRQSAAASRERKKHHIRELERRVTMLSQENAELQCEQLQVIRVRIEKERLLLKENKELKRTVFFKDMKIESLSKQLHDLKPGSGDKDLKRPSTWDASEWSKRNIRLTTKSVR